MNSWWKKYSGQLGILVFLLSLLLLRNPHWIGLGKPEITFSINDSCILERIDVELKEVGTDWRIAFTIGYLKEKKRTFELPNKGLYLMKNKNSLFNIWTEETIKVTGPMEFYWCPNC